VSQFEKKILVTTKKWDKDLIIKNYLNEVIKEAVKGR
jgi:hypothetical protein